MIGLSIPPLKQLLIFYLAKHFWGPPFKPLGNQPWKLYPRKVLINHRERVKSNISRIHQLPLLLQTYLKEGVLLLEQAYNQLFQWQAKYDERNRLSVLNYGTYFAPHYFTVDGNFNDVAFVRVLVSDTRQCISRRFNFACLYCFEDEIIMLWNDLDNYNMELTEEVKTSICQIWMHKLTLDETDYSDFEDYSPYEGGSFELTGIRRAINEGYEHATYYFWKLLSDTQKDDLIRNDILFYITTTAAILNFYKIVHFVYSELSFEHKNDYLTWIVKTGTNPHIWRCLIKSPLTQSILLNEILHFPYPVPAQVYASMLNCLAYFIGEIKTPFYREAFQKVWRNISKEIQIYTFEKHEFLLESLIRAKEMDVVGLCMKSIPHEQKRKFLLTDSHGIRNINILCDQGNYDILQQYISFFFTEINTTSHSEFIQEKKASTLLQDLNNAREFKCWLLSIDQTKEKEVNKVIDALQNSLDILNHLQDQVEKNATSFTKPDWYYGIKI